ncbi:hypothetical protein CRUP_018996 [Coryphaenoides rupestris]|nr:hypothetical protein CRUP_018996 [Coryphaenoides rupestris]
MSGVCQDRMSRWQDIQKGLQFIQSTLPYPGTQDQYEVFIKDLVLNLFCEGNDVFKEGDWTKSIEMYTEALSIAEYADSEEIAVPMGLLENLYVNRAASYLNIVPGLYDQALKDCEKVLALNEGNYKAHYRKAKSLRELGRHGEAYDAMAKCSLVVPQDPSVIQLTQELAKALGLKIRKAYYTHCPSSVEDIDSEVPHYGVNQIPMPVQVPLATVAPPLNDHMLDDAHSSSSSSSPMPMPVAEAPGFHHHQHHSHPHPHHLLPAPLALRPSPSPVTVAGATPAACTQPLVNGSGPRDSHPLLDSSQESCDGEIIGDDLDDLLDQAGPADCPLSPFFMPSHIGVFGYAPQPQHCAVTLPQHCTVTLPPVYQQPGSSVYLGMDTLDSLSSLSSPLDSLDTLSTLSMSDYRTAE